MYKEWLHIVLRSDRKNTRQTYSSAECQQDYTDKNISTASFILYIFRATIPELTVFEERLEHKRLDITILSTAN